MVSEPQGHQDHPQQVRMPTATVAPLVLAIGVAMILGGIATNLTLSAVGVLLFLIGLGQWVSQLLPGRGHIHEPFDPALRPEPVVGIPGTVERLEAGMPGYRFRLPEKVYPISAGIKGGIVGGIVMPIPALAYGILSGNGIWFPINLLAGTVLPYVDSLTKEELQQFRLSLLIVAVLIHAVLSVSLGLIYGVLLPTLPQGKGAPLLWGGLVLPLLWSGFSYGFMGVLNPALDRYVEWQWFVVSQIVYGLSASIIVVLSERVVVPPVGGPKAAEEVTP